MKKFSIRKISIWALSLILFCTGCATGKKYTEGQEFDESKMSGTLTLEMKEIALAIGKMKGEGILTFQGEDYPFAMSGLDVGGISKVTTYATGKVSNLDDLADFEGIYFRGKASLSINDSGKTGMFLINRHRVMLKIVSDKEKGFDLALGRGGIKIKFKNKDKQ